MADFGHSEPVRKPHGNPNTSHFSSNVDCEAHITDIGIAYAPPNRSTGLKGSSGHFSRRKTIIRTVILSGMTMWSATLATAAAKRNWFGVGVSCLGLIPLLIPVTCMLPRNEKGGHMIWCLMVATLTLGCFSLAYSQSKKTTTPQAAEHLILGLVGLSLWVTGAYSTWILWQRLSGLKGFRFAESKTVQVEHISLDLPRIFNEELILQVKMSEQNSEGISTEAATEPCPVLPLSS